MNEILKKKKRPRIPERGSGKEDAYIQPSVFQVPPGRQLIYPAYCDWGPGNANTGDTRSQASRSSWPSRGRGAWCAQLKSLPFPLLSSLIPSSSSLLLSLSQINKTLKKKKRTTDTHDTHMNLKCILLNERGTLKRLRLYDSINITL